MTGELLFLSVEQLTALSTRGCAVSASTAGFVTALCSGAPQRVYLHLLFKLPTSGEDGAKYFPGIECCCFALEPPVPPPALFSRGLTEELFRAWLAKLDAVNAAYRAQVEGQPPLSCAECLAVCFCLRPSRLRVRLAWLDEQLRAWEAGFNAALRPLGHGAKFQRYVVNWGETAVSDDGGTFNVPADIRRSLVVSLTPQDAALLAAEGRAFYAPSAASGAGTSDNGVFALGDRGGLPVGLV